MNHPEMLAPSQPFGETRDGNPVALYTLTNSAGMSAQVMTYGATLTRLRTPDRDGNLGDVTLGFDTLEPYETISPYFGAIVGRVANRIAKGRFTLNGTDYQLAINNGPNTLHGGIWGYGKRVWNAEATGPASVRFWLHDPAGTEGFPGDVDLEVVYTLTEYGTLRLEYTAGATEPTPVNFTNHAYFNLRDGGRTDVLDHILQLHARAYTPVDETLIPTGEIAPVEGTPIDFRTPKSIGSDLLEMGGYDHNLVLDGEAGNLRHIATVSELHSGRTMETWTTEPGVQFYTGNFLDGSITGRDGAIYGKHHGFCLETQHFPDSVNQPNFPRAVLSPGETYRQTTEYRFGVASHP